MQVLGSVLLWAHRAGATRVIHKPGLQEPLLYYSETGTPVESEFTQPTEEVRDDLRQTLFLDTYDGGPLLRPIRRFLRTRSDKPPQMRLEVPDDDRAITSTWHMTIGADDTTFHLVDVAQHPPPPAE